ncbi:MAG: universal stress protein [Geodermatophilaceae bacterium]
MPDTARIVVGYDGGQTGEDALAVGTRWCRASGDRLVVVTVHPGHHAIGPARVDAEWVAYEREEADRLLEEAQALVGPDIAAEYERVDAGSAAHGLHDIAEAGGTLVVLGTRRAGRRRTSPGSTANRLMHGSALPVAIVPWGYADTSDSPLKSAAVAYVDTPDGRVALSHAVRFAAHLSGRLRIVSVVPDTRVLPGLGEPRLFGIEQREDYRRALDEAVASAGSEVEVSGDLRDGPVVDALTELGPDDADLLVCGSRGYGPVLRVLLGGVSSRVVRGARIPVVVVPRGQS